MSNAATRFSADRQPARRRGKEQRTKILEAIKEETKLNEKGFYKAVAKKALTEGDTLMMKELLTRVAPAAKPVAPSVQFDFPEDGTPVAQVDAACARSRLMLTWPATKKMSCERVQLSSMKTLLKCTGRLRW